MPLSMCNQRGIVHCCASRVLATLSADPATPALQAAPVIMASFFSCRLILSRLMRVDNPASVAPTNATLAASRIADTDSTVPTFTSVDATMAVVTAFCCACGHSRQNTAQQEVSLMSLCTLKAELGSTVAHKGGTNLNMSPAETLGGGSRCLGQRFA